ncbi:MAG TPA: cation-transporting P-type ATPase [Acidimicrobiia bacterium]|nr:cation-transporting P-type ATPase [Acidimicrobiia bacterium]
MTSTVPAPALEQFSALRAEDVYSFCASSASGLSQIEAERRLVEHGPNAVTPAARRRFLYRFASNFVHVMAVLLWVGGGVAFAAGLPELGVAIWVVNVVNGLFSFWQEHKAEKATEALLRLLPTTATVLRDGRLDEVDATTLVPGDVVVIEEGDRISADGRLVEHVSLRVDQSTLTGESRLVRKASEPVDPGGNRLEMPNLVYAGTTVAAGRGKLVVTATGARTELGGIADLTQSLEEAPSPLQIELRRVSITVSVIAVMAGTVFFLLALLLADMPLARGFVFALGMIVAFVPEGLLPTVTLSLAMGTQRMAARNALVKKLSSVETLGCTTVICTDKTGTLTANEMTVRSVTVDGQTYRFEGVGYVPVGEVIPFPGEGLQRLLTGAVLASNARLTGLADGRWSIVGDPTEGAILTAACKAGIDLDDISARYPRSSEIPFDSTRKRMSSVNRLGEGLVMFTKGAPAELLTRCESRYTDDGPAPLTEGDRRAVIEAIDTSAKDGLRVLGVAQRPVSAPPFPQDDVETELEFLGLIAMHDPPRPEVEAAIGRCRSAGIRIVMITGDYGVTAEAIGRRIGMIESESIRVVNGSDLEELDDAELSDILDGDVVFARSAPVHKLRVVEALQAKGEVVAVTGDGVNDAPALKKADIGVAMGQIGTDVAKEAADIILLDDNFASIVAAVEEGRAVYDNIKKFTTYILTSNTPEAVPFVVFAFSGGRIPIALDVMHILAIDLGTDLAPALALGAEKPEPGVMERPPRSLDAHLIDRQLLTRSYLWLGPLQAAFVMAAFFGAYRLAGFQGWLDLPSDGPTYRSATAMALAAVVATQIGNLFAQRSVRVSLLRMGLGNNRLLWWGILSEVLVIILIVFVPTFQDVIGTAPFPAVGWVWLLLGVPLLPIADEFRKALLRRRERARP